MTEDRISVDEFATIVGVSKSQATRYCLNGLIESFPGKKRGRGYARTVRRADAIAFVRPKHGPKGPRKGVADVA